MASQDVLDDFLGASEGLSTTVPGTLTGLTTAEWVAIDQSGSPTSAFVRTSSGTTAVMPAAGQARYARLDMDTLVHSAGVTTFEASIAPGGQLRVNLDFGTRFLSVECGADGSGNWMWNQSPSTVNGSFTGTAPGAFVVLRIEVTSTATRYYVDNVLKYTHSSGVPYSTVVNSVRLGYPRVFAAHGYSTGATVLALNYLHLKTEATTGPLGGPGGGDTIGPTFPSTVISVAALYTSYTATWPTASDNVDAFGTVAYEYRINGGGFVSNGTATTLTRTGLAPGTSEVLEVRAKDAAGNYSSSISTTATAYLLPTEQTLFSDTFTGEGVLRGSPGQTGLFARSIWGAKVGTFGGGTIPGGSGLGVVSDTDAFARSSAGLAWTAGGDAASVSGSPPPGSTAEMPVVMEVAGRGDFRALFGLNGVAYGMTIYNTTAGTGKLVVYGGVVPSGWASPPPGEPATMTIPAVVKDQTYTMRVERTLDSVSYFLDGVLMGVASSATVAVTALEFWGLTTYTAHANPAFAVGGRALTDVGETVQKYRYLHLRAGRLVSGPLGAPRDPHDDPPFDPSPPLGPGNEPDPTNPFADFWTKFNATYEVP